MCVSVVRGALSHLSARGRDSPLRANCGLRRKARITRKRDDATPPPNHARGRPAAMRPFRSLSGSGPTPKSGHGGGEGKCFRADRRSIIGRNWRRVRICEFAGGTLRCRQTAGRLQVCARLEAIEPRLAAAVLQRCGSLHETHSDCCRTGQRARMLCTDVCDTSFRGQLHFQRAASALTLI
jgi:hypothetical protein